MSSTTNLPFLQASPQTPSGNNSFFANLSNKRILWCVVFLSLPNKGGCDEIPTTTSTLLSILWRLSCVMLRAVGLVKLGGISRCTATPTACSPCAKKHRCKTNQDLTKTNQGFVHGILGSLHSGGSGYLARQTQWWLLGFLLEYGQAAPTAIFALQTILEKQELSSLDHRPLCS